MDENRGCFVWRVNIMIMICQLYLFPLGFYLTNNMYFFFPGWRVHKGQHVKCLVWFSYFNSKRKFENCFAKSVLFFILNGIYSPLQWIDSNTSFANLAVIFTILFNFNLQENESWTGSPSLPPLKRGRDAKQLFFLEIKWLID